MRLAGRRRYEIVEGDLTPMIDMTFQLIAFFMLVINFSDAEQDIRVTLPSSELAQPPDSPYEQPLTIHITEEGKYIYAGAILPTIDALRSALIAEKQIIDLHMNKNLEEVTVIIRADQDSRAGQAQEVIEVCQNLQFERFALRGKQSVESTIGN